MENSNDFMEPFGAVRETWNGLSESHGKPAPNRDSGRRNITDQQLDNFSGTIALSIRFRAIRDVNRPFKEKIMKVMSGLLAATLSISFAATAAIPAEAAPMYVPQAPVVAPSDIQAVDFNPQLKNRHFRGNRNLGGQRSFNGNRNFGDRGNGGYWNGHRGYSYYRPGYRRHGDFWFPLAAFAAGAVISGAIVNGENRGNAHVRWCYDRYRSYRASDNTFQPNNGPRQQCRSPY